MISEERIELFNFYQSFDSPILNITSKIEVPNFSTDLKLKQVSLFQYITYCICKSVMENQNFKLRYGESKIYEIDKLVPSYTVMREGEVFNFCSFDFNSKFDQFLRLSLDAKNIAERMKLLNRDDFSHKNYIFITCIPWFDFTSIQHPVSAFKDLTIPSFAFGKIEFNSDVLSFPFSIQAHHGLVDGIHIHKFISSFKTNLSKVLLEI